MNRRFLLLPVLAGCAGGGAPDSELLGDRAYAAGRFPEAVIHYDAGIAARPDGRLWAKLGAAALHAGALQRAGEAYTRLGTEDPTRTDEAADGLEQVVHAASLGADGAALRPSLLALRRIAPGRPVLRYALAVARDPSLGPADAITVLPQALAAADEPRTVDSLLAQYGRALEQTASCEAAALAFGAALRRSADSGLRSAARSGLAACSMRLGTGALASGRPADAERWFSTVTATDSTSPLGRRALVGLGDARRARADTAGAISAYTATVALGGGADSLSQLAAARLSALRPQQTAGDSSRTGIP